ncbi:MAG: type III polyketide synthase [Actinomycetota bacterium]|nr:type III polyketide synthase [Actinomycetota bacterium]
MSRILAVAPVAAPHRYEQGDLTAMFADLVGLAPERRELLDRLHLSCGVQHRNLALPVEDYKGLDGFGDSNDAFIEVGLDLGEQAIVTALDRAGLAPADVDLILMTSVTGIAAPSLDARLVSRLGLRPDVKRIPVFGLGCVAGAAGISRLHDYLVGHPRHVAVLLSVELCSLTVQRDDDSLANLVGSGLFGDGAAAVVMVGDAVELDPAVAERAPSVVATRSRFFADTERVMGWDIGGSGFRIVLSPGVADVVRDHLPAELDSFLAGHDLRRGDVQRWVAHPGGPRVLDALQESLDLPAQALALSWQSLADVGNLSSSSVLHVLSETLELEASDPKLVGAHGLLMAMGPGFCAELVLLRWPGGHP